MATLTEFTTPQIELGEYINVLAGNANQNGAIISTQQGDFVRVNYNHDNPSDTTLKHYAILKQNEYPDLYAKLGLISATTWQLAAPYFSATDNGVNYAQAFGYGNGLFLRSAPTNYWTSTNGINWSNNTSGLANTSNYPHSFTYGNGIYLYCSNFGGIATSTNGTTWTGRNSGTTSALRFATYGNSIFVVCGDGGVIRTSTDGITWTARTSGTTSNLNALTYGNGLYVVANAGNNLRTSTDGITWTLRTTPSTAEIRTLFYGNGLYLFGDASSPPMIATSTNGITWIKRFDSTGIRPGFPAGIYLDGNGTYGNGVYVVVGDISSFNPYFTSSDGINWSHNPAYSAITFSPTHLSWSVASQAVIYGNGLFVAQAGAIADITNEYSRFRPIISRNPMGNLVYSNYYDANTEFLIPSYTNDGINLSIPNTRTNSSARYITYMRVK